MSTTLRNKQHTWETSSFISIYSRGMTSQVDNKGFVGENYILVYEVSDRFQFHLHHSTCSFHFNR